MQIELLKTVLPDDEKAIKINELVQAFNLRQFRCGKCEQANMIVAGKEMGEIIPEHHSGCSLASNPQTPNN